MQLLDLAYLPTPTGLPHLTYYPTMEEIRNPGMRIVRMVIIKSKLLHFPT
jgi:hypothetical protein